MTIFSDFIVAGFPNNKDNALDGICATMDFHSFLLVGKMCYMGYQKLIFGFSLLMLSIKLKTTTAE